MNTKKLEQRRRQADKKWSEFQNNQRPLIYVVPDPVAWRPGRRGDRSLGTYVKDKKQDVDVVRVGCIGLAT